MLEAAIADGVFLNKDSALPRKVFSGVNVFRSAGGSGALGVSDRMSGGQNLQ